MRLRTDILQLRPIYFPIGFALPDEFLEAPETFTVFIILTGQYSERNNFRDRAIVTIFDTTRKNLFKHICIYMYMKNYLIILVCVVIFSAIIMCSIYRGPVDLPYHCLVVVAQ